ADDQPRAAALELDHGERAMLLEVGRGVPVLLGQGNPELEASEPTRVSERRLFGVGDTAARGHQVEDAGGSRSRETAAVVVNELPFQEPRDCLETDVRVGRDV